MYNAGYTSKKHNRVQIRVIEVITKHKKIAEEDIKQNKAMEFDDV
jgi:hypothetical protein